MYSKKKDIMNQVELKNTINPTTVGQSLSGRYKIFIIDKDNNIVWEQPDWQKNLILNQGMDAVALYSYADCMNYAAAGNGTNANSVSSGVSSGSVAGSILTLYPSGSGLQNLTDPAGGWSSAVQVGDVIQFNDISQSQVMVSASVSSQTAVVSPVTSFVTTTTQSFTIWKTSQVGLQGELHRTANFFGGTGYCGTTSVGNVVKNRRTWDFNYETSSVSFTEVGVGWAASGNNTIFSRVLLPTSASIGAGQKMRLIYEMDISIYPNVVSPGVPFTSSIPGWGTVYGYQNVGNYLISNIDGGGGTTGAPVLDPASYSGYVSIFATDSTTANGNSGVGVDRTGTTNRDSVPTTLSPYIPSSYTIYKNVTFAVNQLTLGNIQTIGLGWTGYNYPYAANSNAFCCVFTAPQVKSNTQTLTLSFIFTWGRVLS